tara:strand:+ start:170 stop:319 length:150 start_codon:yes stop_codon:yes gene_type:complete
MEEISGATVPSKKRFFILSNLNQLSTSGVIRKNYFLILRGVYPLYFYVS